MIIKNKIIVLILIFGIIQTYGQETILNLKDAVAIAILKSNEAVLSNTKIESKKLELDVVKNIQNPDFKISGQYLRLAGATVDLPINGASQSSNSRPAPNVNELIIGQANINMPLFSGFKIQNTIAANENLYKAEQSRAIQTKEEVALKVVEYYANLYRAKKSIKLISENLKSASQRVTDFEDLEKNGVIARNDLLKAQLQQSNVQLSLDNAKKNTAIANYKLITLLKLPESTEVDIDIEAVKRDMASNQGNTAQGERNDLKSLEFKKQAAESGIKIAKANYYPSLNLTGGYIAFDLNNVLTVTNAMNFGLGFSYDLASIFKNSKNVKLAQSKTKETEIALSLMTDQIKEEVFMAQENYTLSTKQSLVYDKAVVQATENYRIVKDKYDNSLSDTNDLLEADFQQLQAKINQALSKADVAQKYYELQFASGKLTASLNITQK